jgi:hypothetical protein
LQHKVQPAHDLPGSGSVGAGILSINTPDPADSRIGSASLRPSCFAQAYRAEMAMASDRNFWRKYLPQRLHSVVR